jgi:uncharacterized membrane protein YozB (DUF420 family)
VNATSASVLPDKIARERRALVVAVLVAALPALWFLRRDAMTYLTVDITHYTEYYWPRRYALMLHVAGGCVPLSVGLLQTYLGLSGRARRVHRGLGYVYLSAGALASLAAFYLAATMVPMAPVYASGLVGLGLAWWVTTSLAYSHIRQGALRKHRAWMLRSYIVTFGFVTLRSVQLGLTSFGISSEERSYDVAAWACWTVPLVLIEPLIRSRIGTRQLRGAID